MELKILDIISSFLNIFVLYKRWCESFCTFFLKLLLYVWSCVQYAENSEPHISLDINLYYKPGQLIVSFKQSQSQLAQYSKRGNSAALHSEIITWINVSHAITAKTVLDIPRRNLICCCAQRFVILVHEWMYAWRNFLYSLEHYLSRTSISAVYEYFAIRAVGILCSLNSCSLGVSYHKQHDSQ